MSFFISFFGDFIVSPILITVLLAGGAYLSARLGFFHITRPGKIVSSMLHSKGKSSGRSPFREVTVALAGTLGVGNLSGVAASIAIGGAGSVFWMWIGALLSALLKYSEIVLAVKFRVRRENGFIGGAMYYIRSPFFKNLFALLCIFTSFTLGNMMQMRAASECFESIFGVSAIVCGVILAAVVFLIIINGHSGVSAFTSAAIPFACAVYILLSVFVIVTNISALPRVFAEIFSSAFTFPAAAGGFLGSLIIALRPVRYGVSRGLITNEAGCGTAPIAHAAADTDSPAAQGFWGIFEVFADTVILCTLSALVLLIARPDFAAAGDMGSVLFSFAKYCGPISDLIISALVLLFAVSGAVGWFYYGTVGLEYLCGTSKGNAKIKVIYALLYALCAALGALFSSELVWDLTHISIGLMAIINTPCVISYCRLISRETSDFFQKGIKEK